MTIKAPCRFCEARYEGCHSSCLPYREYIEQKKEEREQIKRAKDFESLAFRSGHLPQKRKPKDYYCD